MSTITYSDVLVVMCCGGCGINFAVPEDFYDARLRDRKIWTCPNGCRRHFKRTVEDELREQLEAEQRRTIQARADRDRAMEEAAHAEAKARGYKGAMVQAKKRATKGLCPVPGCKRSFSDVARHVASKHPAYEDGE